MSNDDAFSGELTNEVGGYFYGEVVINQAIAKAIMTYDVDGVTGWQEYDSNLKAHKTAMATPTQWGDRKVPTVYELQDFPIGLNFEVYSQSFTSTSKGWKMFEESMAKLHGLEAIYETEEYVKPDGSKGKRPTGAARAANKELYAVHMLALSKGGCFFQFDKRKFGTRKGKDGNTYDKKVAYVLHQYKSAEECQAAYEANLDDDLKAAASSVPTGTKVEALAREQAIGFVKTLAMQIADKENCWPELQAKFDEQPMLGNLKTDDKDVIAAAVAANPGVFDDVPF